MKRKRNKINVVTLGCPKNLVDSEILMKQIDAQGIEVVHDAVDTDARTVIINTCGFIQDAKEESIDTILGHIRAKEEGALDAVYVMGCLSERYKKDLQKEIPEVDRYFGVNDIRQIIASLGGNFRKELVGERLLGTPSHYAYLKISEGCDRKCSFCAIPLIRGKQKSRTVEEITAEAGLLADRGVREIILIAQDTTDYGRDLGMREGPSLGKVAGLAELLDQLVEAAPQVAWIRLMYTYPDRVTGRLIETMARHPQILPYLDIPLQHAHPDVLRRMRRPPDVGRVQRTIERLRAAMPEIAIRTTFLVGFPGETEAEFQTLLGFVGEMEFDRVGVFAYSHEAGTPAARLEDDVPPEVKEERRERLMAVQQPISLAKNQALVGQTLDVLIEGQGDGMSVGRSYRDAPEIDGLVLVQAELPVGKIVPVRITAAMEYDLVGEALQKDP